MIFAVLGVHLHRDDLSLSNFGNSTNVRQYFHFGNRRPRYALNLEPRIAHREPYSLPHSHIASRGRVEHRGGRVCLDSSSSLPRGATADWYRHGAFAASVELCPPYAASEQTFMWTIEVERHDVDLGARQDGQHGCLPGHGRHANPDSQVQQEIAYICCRLALGLRRPLSFRQDLPRPPAGLAQRQGAAAAGSDPRTVPRTTPVSTARRKATREQTLNDAWPHGAPGACPERRRTKRAKSPWNRAYPGFRDNIPDTTRYIRVSALNGRKARLCWPSGAREAEKDTVNFGRTRAGLSPPQLAAAAGRLNCSSASRA